MAVTGKGAEGIDLAARAMAWAYEIDRRPADPEPADELGEGGEAVPEPRDP